MISDKEISKIIKDLKPILDGLAKYDSRYIGNVPEKEARKLFPEMFKERNEI